MDYEVFAPDPQEDAYYEDLALRTAWATMWSTPTTFEEGVSRECTRSAA